MGWNSVSVSDDRRGNVIKGRLDLESAPPKTIVTGAHLLLFLSLLSPSLPSSLSLSLSFSFDLPLPLLIA